MKNLRYWILSAGAEWLSMHQSKKALHQFPSTKKKRKKGEEGNRRKPQTVPVPKTDQPPKKKTELIESRE